MLRRLASGVGANALDKLVVSGTQLAMVPVLASAWGLHLYGLWVLMFTAPSFLAMGDFGLSQAAGTKMTMAVARGERAEAVHIFQSAWAAILVSSAIITALIAALAFMIPVELFGLNPGMTEREIRGTLFLLMIYGVAAVQGSIFFAGFRAAGLFPVGAIWNAFVILFESCVLLLVVILGARPLLAAATILSCRIIGLIGQNSLLRLRVPWLTVGLSRSTLTEVKSLVTPAGAVMLLPIAQAFYLQGTALALGASAGQAAVPVFTAARTLSRAGLQLCWLINTPLMPEFSAASARGDRQAQALMVLATLTVSTVLVIPYSSTFALIGRSVITIWTHGVIFVPESLLWVMSGSLLFGGFWFPLSNLILALNRHKSYTGWFVLMACISVPLTYALAGPLGATGAGIAMFTLDFGMFVVVAALSPRLLITREELRWAVSEVAGRVRASINR